MNNGKVIRLQNRTKDVGNTADVKENGDASASIISRLQFFRCDWGSQKRAIKLLVRVCVWEILKE